MVRYALIGAAVLAMLLLLGDCPAQDAPKPAAVKKPTVMERKLTHAHKVLEGVAKQDFKAVAAGAEGLTECVKEATWKINETDKYLMFSDNFLRSVEGLQKAAKEKNVDAAALSYVDMTLACVKCHRYLRDEGITRLPDTTPFVAVKP